MPKTKTRGPISVRLAVALVLVAAGLAASGSLLQAWMTVTGRFLWTGGGADPRQPIEFLPQLLQADVREGFSFYLEDLPVWLRAAAAGPALIYAITVTLAAVLVARMLRTIASGDAFGPGVRRPLGGLSLTLLGGGVLHGLADTAAWWLLLRNLPRLSEERGEGYSSALQGIGYDLPDWPVMLIVLGLIAAALTIAFRQGARLREEMAGVI